MSVQETTDTHETAESHVQSISACVRRFYAMANVDPLLGPIFAAAIKDWPEHFRHMDDFWSRILLASTRYRRNPFVPHHGLDLKDVHFDRWRALFQEAARETLPEPLREHAVAAAGQMSHCWRQHMIGHPADRLAEAPAS